MYEIHWPGMYVTQWLERLSQSERIDAIAYIIGIHRELDGTLIKYMDDTDDNCLLNFIQPVLSDRETAELLIAKGLGDFSLKDQKLLFSSKESAEAMSLKIKKIYYNLKLFAELLGRDYLNLESIDPRNSNSKADYTVEMEELLNEYWSLFPREMHKVFQ